MDIIFFHVPSFFSDTCTNLWQSSSVSSSGRFEIFPVGLQTMANYLIERNYSAEIINLSRTVQTLDDLEQCIKNIKPLPRFFGVSLHWLPHASGVASLIKVLKKHYPDIPIIVGGLSATYFWKELISKKEIDFLIKGICCEESVYQLLESRLAEEILRRIPNLVWKKNGCVICNHEQQMAYPLINNFKYIIENDHEKWEVLFYKGCLENCIYCGGNNHALKLKGLIYVPEEIVIKQIMIMEEKAPKHIKIYGDIRAGNYNKLLDMIKEIKIKSRLTFEFFYPAENALIDQIADSCNTGGFEITISPDSSDRKIRRMLGKRDYDNESLEKMFDHILHLGGVGSIFFMLGLPTHTSETILEEYSYINELYAKFIKYKKRFKLFFTTLAPFIDPGSRIFNDPEKYGYKIFSKTLDYYENVLLEVDKAKTINYETVWSSREKIIEMMEIIESRMRIYYR